MKVRLRIDLRDGDEIVCAKMNEAFALMNAFYQCYENTFFFLKCAIFSFLE